MIDENLKVYLIEVNTNPCLEQSSSLLTRLLSNLIENVLRYIFFDLNLLKRIAVDPIYPAPSLDQWKAGRREAFPIYSLEKIQFELIFDDLTDGEELKVYLN